jgi:hypothetical protein
MRPARSSPEKNYASPSLPDVLKNFHCGLPLAGDPPNALLSLPDDLLTYLIAAIRNTPQSPPDLSCDDWRNVLALLRPHMIYPLLTSHVRTWPEECRPPQEIMNYLNRVFLMAAARNMRAGRQIQSVTDALKDAGIPVILLKGHALARTVYPDPALRQSSDIDLLVKPGDMIQSEAILTRLGYTCQSHTFRIVPNEHPHQVFYPPNKGIHIELHWGVDGGFSLFEKKWIDTAFEQKIPVQSTDLSCFTLDDIHHLQFLAFHTVFGHYSIRLDWVFDIACLMQHLRIPEDWERLCSASTKNHIRIPVELALTAGSLWSGYTIPAEFRDFSLWPAPSERELRLWRHAQVRHTNLRSDLYLRLQSMPTFSEKMKFCFRFFLPQEELLQSYRRSSSSADIPLAHIRRWFSIVKYR